MKTAKTILSIITIVFAILGLTRIIPSNIANPITITSLATVILLIGLELKTNNKNGFIVMFIIALFAYVIVLYTTFR